VNTNSSATTPLENFIIRWKASGASERANYQLFLTELCYLLGVEKPKPASANVKEAVYSFERPVVFDDGEGSSTTNFIDLYKQQCFVLEAKQGSDKPTITEAELLGAPRVKTKTGTATRETRNWEREMKKAKEQALRYARSLPADEGWPPFLVVVDVGYCIDLYADFARQGKIYVPFPDPQNYRILLTDLYKEEIQVRLQQLFTNPLELDPSKRAAKVTRELAERLAKLASLFEASGHPPEKVAGFLMRCLFTMFAEDVELLPERSFTKLLQDYRTNLILLPDALRALWTSMDRGGFDPALRTRVRQFNGFLFKDQEALPLTEAQLDLLILAAEAGWGDVEPAIFGTLLERALEPHERHKLGAHYTPRAYVERLVMPTVIEPLREEWEAARTASAILEADGNEAGALKEIESFHRRLCSVKVLDPACGSGNFLYVTLEHLKRLEGEVTAYMENFPRQLMLDMSGGYTVTPAQLLGLEINPRAAAIADVVLWIGYLQWHFRAHGNAKRLEDPILRQYGNIKQRDSVLTYSQRKARLDAVGNPIMRWDGYTTKQHPVTGFEVPDESARTPVYDYYDCMPAEWPETDFIIGNPPFVGNKRMRETLGDGYTEALRSSYKGAVPDSADFVMYWWYKAAQALAAGKIAAFGFITTNSLTQSFNRKVLQDFLDSSNPIYITYAIPDHPWVDSNEGAAVRIAMTVAKKTPVVGRLDVVFDEVQSGNLYVDVKLIESSGVIYSNLKTGADVASTNPLQANKSVSSFGMMLAGSGFIVTKEKALELGLGSNPELEERIRPYRNGKDLTSIPRGLYLLDMFPLNETEIRSKFPEVYQHLFSHVKPERDQNNRARLKEKWWLFGECRQGLRAALTGLSRYISTPETAKHRFFVFQNASILPDHKLVNIAMQDSYYLGVLSSKYHVLWAMASGGRLGVGNDSIYNSTRCFQTFPFPIPTEIQRTKIRTIAENLDAHRKRQQMLNLTLTITDMYNVLDKVRSGQTLNLKEQTIHEQGLVSILHQLHSELDIVVAEAYGWQINLKEEVILEKLVALNKERAEDESRGIIRWLRPEYQNANGGQQANLNMEMSEVTIESISKKFAEWPKNLADQAQTVQRLVRQFQYPVTASELSKQFKPGGNASKTREHQIENLLQTLNSLGLIRKTEQGSYIK
jgi:hypothetical protein